MTGTGHNKGDAGGFVVKDSLVFQAMARTVVSMVADKEKDRVLELPGLFADPGVEELRTELGRLRGELRGRTVVNVQ